MDLSPGSCETAEEITTELKQVINGNKFEMKHMQRIAKRIRREK